MVEIWVRMPFVVVVVVVVVVARPTTALVHMYIIHIMCICLYNEFFVMFIYSLLTVYKLVYKLFRSEMTCDVARM